MAEKERTVAQIESEIAQLRREREEIERAEQEERLRAEAESKEARLAQARLLVAAYNSHEDAQADILEQLYDEMSRIVGYTNLVIGGTPMGNLLRATSDPRERQLNREALVRQVIRRIQ